MAPVLFHRYMYRSTLVFHQKHHEFRRLGFARISSHDMDILWPLVEGLTGHKPDFLSTPDLHHYRTLQHVNKCMCVMTMYGF